jgi:diacylglycerol kinase family enzyme
MNGKRMGGSFFMGPNAEIGDGLFDICAVTHRGRIGVIKIIAAYTKGEQGKQPGVTQERASELRIVAQSGGMAAHCDGETVCEDGKELGFRCVPQALRLLSK